MSLLLFGAALTFTQLDPTKDDLSAELKRAKGTVQVVQGYTHRMRIQTASIEDDLEILNKAFERNRAQFNEQKRGRITNALQGIEDNLKGALDKHKLLTKTMSEAESLLREAERLKERDKKKALEKARAAVAKLPEAEGVLKDCTPFVRAARSFVDEAKHLMQP